MEGNPRVMAGVAGSSPDPDLGQIFSFPGFQVSTKRLRVPFPVTFGWQFSDVKLLDIYPDPEGGMAALRGNHSTHCAEPTKSIFQHRALILRYGAVQQTAQIAASSHMALFVMRATDSAKEVPVCVWFRRIINDIQVVGGIFTSFGFKPPFHQQIHDRMSDGSKIFAFIGNISNRISVLSRTERPTTNINERRLGQT